MENGLVKVLYLNVFVIQKLLHDRFDDSSGGEGNGSLPCGARGFESIALDIFLFFSECLADAADQRHLFGGNKHGADGKSRQTLRILETLERRSPDYPGLNLTWEVREGIIKHQADSDARAPEEYARGEYLMDLMRGPNDKGAVDRMTQKVAVLVGLPEPVVRQYGARIDSFIYRREANRATGRTASIYDSSVKSFDPEPTSYFPASNEDPFTTGYAAPVTSAILDLYGSRLGYRPTAAYQMSNRQALRDWVYPNNPYSMSSIGELRSVLALDPKLKVLVAHGFTDTITPYFGSEMALTQIPVYGDPARLKLSVYPGGHMFYSREASRKAFRAEVAKLLE